ncbi:hypothetical protein SLEP1_g47927 [Rubroshorea leprosula]|uniref:Uncharacterized protein n=1 Tax=Rubroshorea leprosula TaxID=152421 RepID=A0AAV5LSZ7_9ROSI|nr:hypothetical protein SLEP1_g47927 [Rubroshorea leprosula]
MQEEQERIELVLVGHQMDLRMSGHQSLVRVWLDLGTDCRGWWPLLAVAAGGG